MRRETRAAPLEKINRGAGAGNQTRSCHTTGRALRRPLPFDFLHVMA